MYEYLLFRQATTRIYFSSVDSVLQSREADPEEILLNLGFGGSEQLSRIPARFLRHKSAAKGITVESFLSKQEDIDSMAEFGFAGYRGLHGSPSRRPSEIVEKILQTLMKTDRELRRKNSAQSWSTTSSILPGLGGGIPLRFRMMDPRRKTFQSVVEEVRRPRRALPANRRTFRGAAQSVLLEKKKKEKVEGEEEEEEGGDDVSESESEIESEDSDWSDEEREELERMFGAMSERGKQVERKRRARKSMRKSRRRGEGGLCGELARLVFSRESCDTFCDSSSSVLTFCDSEGSVSNSSHLLILPPAEDNKKTCTGGVDDDTSSCSYSPSNIYHPPPSGKSNDW